MSEQVERRLLDLLGNPSESPYGNPIPALDEFAEDPSSRFLEGVENLLSRVAAQPEASTAVIKRLGEPVQVDPELLQQLYQAGVRPGSEATIAASGTYVAVQVDGFGPGLDLPNEVAAHIYVAL